MRADRAAVGQGHGVQRQGRAAVDGAARCVVQQTTDGQLLSRAAGQNAATVIQTGGVDGQAVLADQGTVATVEQRATEGHAEVAATAGDRAAIAVVETAAVDRQSLPAGNQTALVDHAGAAHAQLVTADQLAAAVIQGTACHIETLAAGQLTVLVVQVAQAVEAQRSLGVQQTVAVIQVAAGQVQAERLAAQQAPAVLGQGAEVQADIALGRDLTAVAGVQAVGGNRQAALAVDQAIGRVVQGHGIEGHGAGAEQRAALVVQVGAGDVQGLGGVDQAQALVGQ